MKQQQLLVVWALVSGAIIADQGHAQCVVAPQQQLVASNLVAGDESGRSVALSGDALLVGAIHHNSDAGSVAVFRTDGTTYHEEQLLSARNAQAGDHFGHAVALEGSLAVVGAKFAQTGRGAVYVFEFDGTTWQQVQRLRASDRAPDDRFGHSVSIEGDVIAVGAPGDDQGRIKDFSGAVYLFRFDGVQWQEEQKLALTGSPYGSSERFGSSVSVSGDRVAVGAAYQPTGGYSLSGGAYVFHFDGATWQEEGALFASDSEAIDYLGESIALSGTQLAVGSPGVDDDFGHPVGAVYGFSFNGNRWEETQKVTVPRSPYGYHPTFMGWSVALDGDRMIAGGASSNAVYTYRLEAGLWTPTATLVDPNGDSRDSLGWSVALDGNRAAIGVFRSDVAGADAGAAHAHTLTDLALDAEPELAGVGDTLTLTACGGVPSLQAFLFLVEVAGFPTFVPVPATGVFLADGTWTVSGILPSTPGSIEVGFQTLSTSGTGTILASNTARITFQ